jgi:hypothetical protein
MTMSIYSRRGKVRENAYLSMTVVNLAFLLVYRSRCKLVDRLDLQWHPIALHRLNTNFSSAPGSWFLSGWYFRLSRL